MHDTKTEQERVVLIGIDKDEQKGVDIEASLDELNELIDTCGALTVGRLTQKREKTHPGHYFGTGKLDELKDLVSLTNATGIVADDELTPAQHKNMEKILNTKIMDRTMVILDIFAKNAGSAEAKAQVELAQLKYNLSHLVGARSDLSRLGGGIGTRGPGEKKLEVDRRKIRDQITELSRKLEEVSLHRSVLREKREKSKTPVVSMVGYTNAGKSTLMNTLTGAGVLSENKLFATLDTTSRRLALESGSEVVFSDTVGFINKLPHTLIKAFRATLAELSHADVLVHVVDASSNGRDEQMDVVYKTLSELGCLEKPIVTVFNKTDKDVVLPLPHDKNAAYTVSISALTGAGVEKVTEAIERVLAASKRKLAIVLPYSQGNMLAKIHGSCDILNEEHTEKGVFLELYANEEMFNRLKQFSV